jgi:hypothetical protein
LRTVSLTQGVATENADLRVAIAVGLRRLEQRVAQRGERRLDLAPATLLGERAEHDPCVARRVEAFAPVAGAVPQPHEPPRLQRLEPRAGVAAAELERLGHLVGVQRLGRDVDQRVAIELQESPKTPQDSPRRAQRRGGAARPQKNAIVRTSMLSRCIASGGEDGSSNALCPMKRARPSVSES